MERTDLVYTDHAKTQMEKRGITDRDVRITLGGRGKEVAYDAPRDAFRVGYRKVGDMISLQVIGTVNTEENSLVIVSTYWNELRHNQELMEVSA
jgi:hypothetical protein